MITHKGLRLEDFYYRKEFQQRRKDGVIVCDCLLKGEKQTMKSFLRKIKIPLSKSLTKQIDVSLDDPNWDKRMEVLQRLNEIDKQKYLKHLFKKRKN